MALLASSDSIRSVFDVVSNVNPYYEVTLARGVDLEIEREDGVVSHFLILEY
jgi:hypothetical protein